MLASGRKSRQKGDMYTEVMFVLGFFSVVWLVVVTVHHLTKLFETDTDSSTQAAVTFETECPAPQTDESAQRLLELESRIRALETTAAAK